jgi:hypothetical protein
MIVLSLVLSLIMLEVHTHICGCTCCGFCVIRFAVFRRSLRASESLAEDVAVEAEELGELMFAKRQLA